MKAYKVTNDIGDVNVAVYTTIEKAKELQEEHSPLDLQIVEIEINILKWIFLKSMLL